MPSLIRLLLRSRDFDRVQHMNLIRTVKRARVEQKLALRQLRKALEEMRSSDDGGKRVLAPRPLDKSS